MSRTAKIFLGTSVGLSSFVVWGVHYLQKKESDNMFAGVLRDDARQAAKRAERELREKEYQEQLRRRKYLEEQGQTVSNPADPTIATALQKVDKMGEVEFQGCKTC